MLAMVRLTRCTAVALGLFLVSASAAQDTAPRGAGGPIAVAESLTAADREAILEKLAAGIEERYVLEKKGRDLAAQLRQMGAAEHFTEDDPVELAAELTRTLREIGKDLHLRVSHGSMGAAKGGPTRRMVRVPGSGDGAPEEGGARGSSGGDGPKLVRRMGNPDELSGMFSELSARFPENYRAKILPGNIGLLEVDILFPPNDRLAAAMRELADTDALIIDLRTCPGGTNLTTLPFESAFFGEPTHLRTMEHRMEGPVRVGSVEETPGGVKYLDKPVYILTSMSTGSGCESLAWSLKYHDKAVLVGETTAGAGHGITGTVDLGHGLTATVPSMRPIHPRFEGGGWERVGVPPDMTVASRRAADEAYLMALMALMEGAEDDERRQLESLYASTAMDMGRKERQFVDRGRSLRRYCASFEDGQRIHVKDGDLYYTAEDRTRGPLVPLDEKDLFEVTGGMNKTALKVERDDDGAIAALSTSPSGTNRWKRFRRVPAGR